MIAFYRIMIKINLFFSKYMTKNVVTKRIEALFQLHAFHILFTGPDVTRAC